MTAVTRLGKRILLELDSGHSIAIEPRMTGLMLVTRPPTTEHRRMVLHLSPRKRLPRTIEFWDRRGLGTIRLLTENQVCEIADQIGPDAQLMPDTDWVDRLSRTNREIKVALLDQRLVAGIGNLYASEILHAARISPRRRASALRPSEILRIAGATRQILKDAIDCEGSTLGDGTYRNALNRDGSYQNRHRVYQRAGELCPDCGITAIRRIVQAQRSTFLCPECQRTGR